MDYEKGHNIKGHNIFEYYRGPTKGGDTENGDTEETKALENNVTKALINVLELTDGNGEICKRFISWLSGKIGVKLVPPKVDKFLLQQGNPGDKYLGRETAKRILGIVPHGFTEQIYAENTRPETEASIPDAWLLGKKWTILIESKRYDGLDKNQIKNHKGILGDLHKPAVISWKQLYTFFSELKDEPENKRLLNVKNEFLITQFCDFLYLEGLAGFTGFNDNKYFDFFNEQKQKELDAKEKEEIRKELKRKMLALSEDISERTKKCYLKCGPPEGIRKGKNKYDWATFYFLPVYNKGTSDKKVKEVKAHQCIQLGSEGLSVWVRVTNDALRKKLLRKIKTDKDEISRILFKMPKGFFIDLYYYQSEENHKSFLPEDKWEVKLSEFKKRQDLVKYIGEIGEAIEGDGADYDDITFGITRRFEPDEVRNTNGEGLVDKIVCTMKKLDDFVKFVNSRGKRV